MSQNTPTAAMKQLNITFGASKANAAVNRTKERGPGTGVSPSPSTSTEASQSSVADTQTDDKEPNTDDATALLPSTDPDTKRKKEEPDSGEQLQQEGVVEKRVARTSKVEGDGTEATSTPNAQDHPVEPKAKESEVVSPREAKAATRELEDNEKNLNTGEEKAEVEAEVIVESTPVDPIDSMLRVFDMADKYGPGIGMTRLQRWERANQLGLDPPSEVYDVLLTDEGLEDPKYAQHVLEGRI